MLPITRKMQRLSIEISELIGYLKDVRSILEEMQNGEKSLNELKPYINYTFNNMPSIFLKSDKLVLADIIRRVYNEELSYQEALRIIEESIKELIAVREGIIKSNIKGIKQKD